MEQQLDNSLFEINNIKFLPYNFFEQIETNGTVLSSNSYRVISKNHNKVIVLNNIVHSENYTLEDFVNELKKYKKVELHENVLKFIAIIRGKREVTIPGTPKKYRKIYIECWQHDQRPTIQNVFNNLNSIVYNDLFDAEENNENLECKENSTIESDGLNTTDLLQQHINLQSEIEIELKLMSSIVETLKKSKTSLNEKANPFLPNDQNVMKINDDQNVENNDDQEVTSKIDDQEDMNNNDDDQDITDDQFLCDLKTLFTNNNDEPQFLYDLSKLFIDQFNIQGVSKGTSSSIIYEIKEYIDKNYKNPKEILVQYCNHQYRSCFTSIIGFFYEYGIGTDVNYSKAFEMYKEAADDSCFIFNDSSNDHSYFLKENQFIGLISLGSLYTLGKGIDINLQKAFQLFLKSVAKGSIL
ncbi:12906_t:CDS:2, partial [Gigaspora margarita]